MKLIAIRTFWAFALFNASLVSGQNLSGIWHGVAHQKHSGQSGCHTLTLYLSQTGNDISGTSYYCISETPRFAEKAFRGTIAGQSVRVDEAEVLGESAPHDFPLKSGSLVYDPETESLKGIFENKENDAPEPETWTIEIYRQQIFAPLTYCESGFYTISAGTSAVNWYADAELKNLLGTGNTLTLNVRQTTSFFLVPFSGNCPISGPVSELRVEITSPENERSASVGRSGGLPNVAAGAGCEK